MGVAHRDIKPDNILIKSIHGSSDYEIRVADLGLAIFNNDGILTQKCGTPGFVAPEVFSPEGYSYKADIFSLGCVFFCLLTGCYLFVGNSYEQLMRKNINCEIDSIHKYLAQVSTLGKDLFYKMISKDPSIRPSA